MTYQYVPYDTCRKRRQAILGLPKRNVTFSIGSVVAATAFVVCASSPASAYRTIDPVRLHSGSVSGHLAARDEDATFDAVDAIKKIRISSGLTWDRLAKMFGVSRRAVHSWASGESQVRSENQGKISKALEIVRELGSQPSFKIRNELLLRFGMVDHHDGIADSSDPILVSDNAEVRRPLRRKLDGKMRIKRG